MSIRLCQIDIGSSPIFAGVNVLVESKMALANFSKKDALRIY